MDIIYFWQIILVATNIIYFSFSFLWKMDILKKKETEIGSFQLQRAAYWATLLYKQFTC